MGLDWGSPEAAQSWGADRSHSCPGLLSSFPRKHVFLGCWSFPLAAAQGNRSGLRHLVLWLIGVPALPSGHVFPECRGVHHSWQLPEPAAQHLSPLSRWALWIQVCHSCGYRYKLASALWASPELPLVSAKNHMSCSPSVLYNKGFALSTKTLPHSLFYPLCNTHSLFICLVFTLQLFKETYLRLSPTSVTQKSLSACSQGNNCCSLFISNP